MPRAWAKTCRSGGFAQTMSHALLSLLSMFIAHGRRAQASSKSSVRRLSSLCGPIAHSYRAQSSFYGSGIEASYRHGELVLRCRLQGMMIRRRGEPSAVELGPSLRMRA